MLYLFSGSDTFRLLERAKALERDFFASHPEAEKLVIDIEENWTEEQRALLVSTLSPGLFATPHFVVLRHSEVLEEKGGAWLSEALQLCDESAQVMLTIDLGRKKKFPTWWTALTKHKGVVQEDFSELSPKECEHYIETVLKNLDAPTSLEPRAKTFLAQAFLGDTGRLTQELRRLVLQGKTITLEEVEKSIAPTRETMTFQALDALIQGNKGRAIALFRKEETEPDAPFALLGLCAWQVRRLITIKELADEGKDAGTIARELKTSPYPIQKTLPVVQRFSFPRLRQALTLLADLDYSLKTGRIHPGVALDLFIWKF